MHFSSWLVRHVRCRSWKAEEAIWPPVLLQHLIIALNTRDSINCIKLSVWIQLAASHLKSFVKPISPQISSYLSSLHILPSICERHLSRNMLPVDRLITAYYMPVTCDSTQHEVSCQRWDYFWLTSCFFWKSSALIGMSDSLLPVAVSPIPDQIATFSNITLSMRNPDGVLEITEPGIDPTLPPVDFYDFYKNEQLALLWTLFVSILIGNVAVLVSLYHSKQRKTRMNFFVMHLAIADLSVGLISVSTDIAWRFSVGFYLGDFACKSIRYLQCVVTYSSTYVLVALSIDRYDAITHPLNFTVGCKCLSITKCYLFIPVNEIVIMREHRVQNTNELQCHCWRCDCHPSHHGCTSLLRKGTLHVMDVPPLYRPL